MIHCPLSLQSGIWFLNQICVIQIFEPTLRLWLIFLCFQVEHIYLPGPTDWDGGADRLTPGIWRKIQNKGTIVHDISCLQIPDAWVGKGISHESLPHAETQNRDGPPALSHRETNQNLVPEQVRCPQIFWPYFYSSHNWILCCPWVATNVNSYCQKQIQKRLNSQLPACNS